MGGPLSCCKIKLIDWEEGNYRNSDRDDPKIGMPRGEVGGGGEGLDLNLAETLTCRSTSVALRWPWATRADDDWAEDPIPQQTFHP